MHRTARFHWMIAFAAAASTLPVGSPALARIVNGDGGGGGDAGSPTAAATMNDTTVDFGVVRQGSSSVGANLPVMNTGGGDNLGTGVGVMPGNVSATAPGTLAQGKTGHFDFSLSTLTPGQFSSAVSPGDPFKDAGAVSFYDASNGGSSLGSIGLTFDGTVTQLADPTLALSGSGNLSGSSSVFTLDLGSFAAGSGTISTNLEALNSIPNTTYGETLTGAFTSGTSGPFTFAGGAIGNLGGGQSILEALAFDTTGLSPGSYTTSILFNPFSAYAGLTNETLPQMSIRVDANILTPSAPASATVPEPPTWADILVGLGLIGLMI